MAYACIAAGAQRLGLLLNANILVGSSASFASAVAHRLISTQMISSQFWRPLRFTLGCRLKLDPQSLSRGPEPSSQFDLSSFWSRSGSSIKCTHLSHVGDGVVDQFVDRSEDALITLYFFPISVRQRSANSHEPTYSYYSPPCTTERTWSLYR